MERRWNQFLWNPDIYRDKALFDLVDRFTHNVVSENIEETSYVEDAEADAIDATDPTEAPELELESVDVGDQQGSVLYMALLNCVTLQEHSKLSESTQFAVMVNSREHDQYRPLFVSKFHKIEQ